MTKREFDTLTHDYLTSLVRVTNAQLFANPTDKCKTMKEHKELEKLICITFGGRVLHYIRLANYRTVTRRIVYSDSSWIASWVKMMNKSILSSNSTCG